MDYETKSVLAALERWRTKGLVDDGLAAELSAEAVENASMSTRNLTRLLVAVAAAVSLLIAGGLFLDWAWPLMGESVRASLLGIAGVAIVWTGVRLEGRSRGLPTSYLIQIAGLGLMLSAFVYSEEAWSDLSPGGFVMGGLSLAVPIVFAPRAMRRNTVMPAVHLAFGLAFLAVFFDRATWMSADQIVWTLDALLGMALLVLLRILAADGGGARYPWALNAFVVALLAGFALIVATGIGPLDLDEDVFWPLDAWLLLTVAVTLVGIHGGPPGLRRAWFGRALAACMLVWIPCAFVTGQVLLDGPIELGVLLVGGAAIAGFVYADRQHLQELLGASTLAFVVALWAWSVERAGAVGAILALAGTAALLFGISSRLGKGESST